MTSKEMILYFDSKFEAQKELLETKIGDTNKRLDVIIQQNDIRNHRIDVLEEQTNNGNLKCQFIQESKENHKKEREKTLLRNRWLVGTILVVSWLYMTWISYKPTKKIPVELFFQKTDSTMHVPRMYLRDDKTGALREISIDYFDIQK